MTDESVEHFLTEAEETRTLYIDVPILGMTEHRVEFVSHENEAVLVETRTEHQDRFRVENLLDACIEPEAEPPVEATLIHSQSDEDLSRFLVKHPDYRPTRADFRVEAPPGVTAFLKVIQRDSEPLGEEDTEWQEVEIADISVGGIGFQFDDEHNLQYGDVVLVHLQIANEYNFGVKGPIVYVEYLEEPDHYKAGLTFLKLSDEDRKELFNLLNQIKIDKARAEDEQFEMP